MSTVLPAYIRRTLSNVIAECALSVVDKRLRVAARKGRVSLQYSSFSLCRVVKENISQLKHSRDMLALHLVKQIFIVCILSVPH